MKAKIEKQENVSLLNITPEGIENFIRQFEKDIKSSKNKTLVLETGEFGMLLFNRTIRDIAESKDFVCHSTFRNPFKDDSEELSKGQYIVYTIPNGSKIRVEHKPELDKKENICEISGYPIKSQVLYFKEIL